jgi:nicotinate-nucleotide pyrophosphorylase (carboxylating)
MNSKPSFKIPSKTMLQEIIERALQEDIGQGDVTTDSIVPQGINLKGKFIVKAEGILAGMEVVRLCFQQLDSQIAFDPVVDDGSRVLPGEIFATIRGPGRGILSGERVALNFLQRMSGIATLTHRFVQAVAGTGAIILDTRKTAPGLRVLDKWAVVLGGGQNHRFGLDDMVLIKENHIAAAGSMTAAVEKIRNNLQKNLFIEVEVKNIGELKEALPLKVDRILLDNMSPDEMRKAVKITNRQIPLEASGNVGLDNIAAIAETGVQFISVGELTHTVKALDISLLLTRT